MAVSTAWRRPTRPEAPVGRGGRFGANEAAAFLWLALQSRSTLAVRTGAISESLAIDARASRRHAAWRPHLLASRLAILDAAARAPGSHACVILGSGALLDAPIGRLCRRFAVVRAVDLVHPPAARRARRRYSNLELITADLTGLLSALAPSLRRAVWSLWRKPKDDEAARPCGQLAADRAGLRLGDADLVISLNLLSQLPLAADALAARAGRDPKTRAALRRAVVDDHLAVLAKAGGARALICDWRRRLVGADGVERYAHDPLHGASPPPPCARWTWRVAPAPEAAPDADLINDVLYALF